MWHSYYSASTIEDALKELAKHKGTSRILAGATDLMLELERGAHPEIEFLVDITRIPGLDAISKDENNIIHIGPLVTHNHCVASGLLHNEAFPLVQACWGVGAPQIRNRGTIAGNLITASPANDTITPLIALHACVTLRSAHGERIVLLEDFYTGVRKTVIQPDEILVDIFFPALEPIQMGTFIKLGLRKAQAISVVNAAVILGFDKNVISSADITLGAVAPTIIHAREAESYLQGKILKSDVIDHAALLASQSARPIDDLRASAKYRREMVRVLTRRMLQALNQRFDNQDNHNDAFPSSPVLLWGSSSYTRINQSKSYLHTNTSTIQTTINGRQYSFTTGQNKSLLRLLREEAGLMGTKEGCAEGECGACTVFLDGKAVMACLVPAPRAHGAEIITIEGLSQSGHLHPVQNAFIDQSAVQCGYCTPGFIMSGAKLLEEKPHPTRDEIRQAITGNLCRCTGYYKIVTAIEQASQENPVS